MKVRPAKRYIQCRQHAESWQPFFISGGYPIKYIDGKQTGSGVPIKVPPVRLREAKIPCLFRRSEQQHSIRWNRTYGERNVKQKAVR